MDVGDYFPNRFHTSRSRIPGGGYQYSFNPCISFSLGPKKETEFADCQLDVAICMWVKDQMYHKIAEQNKTQFGFYGKNKIPMLHYTGYVLGM
ncbi:hypothetical protein OS493_000746 [Desmophyllum pertusum]|uniref:Uncharacterized protein n=1 Tax=Desmophyllum pertusum TaxID=174260 RepID=A0A9X0A8U7_9CNID|nr:hypothetical protein OS493_000746 [Desmophyllum pertusum]